MESFPAFIPLAGARVVIVGDGEAAEAKARLFEGSPAALVRLSVEAALAPGALDGARLVFVAEKDETLAARVAAAGRAAGALVNVVDRPALCDFATPAIVDRGPVVAAVGTGGAAPVLATVLRGELEARLPESLGAVAAMSRRLQDEVRAALPDLPARRAYWRRLLSGPAAEAAHRGDIDAAMALARAALDAPAATGRVVRLAAPASPDQLTLADLRALGDADRIVAGPEVDPALLTYARRDAERVAGADPDTLARWAAEGLVVVTIGNPP